MLDQIWFDGLAPDEQPLPDPTSRREAILEFWATRADTPEGRMVREVVRTYLEMVVQDSQWPLLPDEIATAEERCGCRLRLDEPLGTP